MANKPSPKTSKPTAKTAKNTPEPSAAELIDAKVSGLNDWRGSTLARVRKIIRKADPGNTETVKWRKPSNPMGVPVWEHGGIICTGETYKAAVKLTFAKGAALDDPASLFNASLDGNARRAIDIHDGDTIDAAALADLVRAAVALNRKGKAEPMTDQPKLLSGGNPQIAKGYGDEPIQAYIAAMPGWKSDVGRRIDELITRTVPGVRKAVKWNSPLYGVEDDVWFLGLHCFAKYIKVSFFRGASLNPIPPGTSKQQHVRYLDIYEGKFEEAQFKDWVKQASKLPGEKM